MGAVRKHGSCAGCAARTAGKRACAMLPARFVLCCTSVLLVQPVTVLFAAQIAAASPVPIHTTEGGRSVVRMFIRENGEERSVDLRPGAQAAAPAGDAGFGRPPF